MAVLTYKVLHGSASTDRLVVPQIKLSIIGS